MVCFHTSHVDIVVHTRVMARHTKSTGAATYARQVRREDTARREAYMNLGRSAIDPLREHRLFFVEEVSFV